MLVSEGEHQPETYVAISLSVYTAVAMVVLRARPLRNRRLGRCFKRHFVGMFHVEHKSMYRAKRTSCAKPGLARGWSGNIADAVFFGSGRNCVSAGDPVLAPYFSLRLAYSIHPDRNTCLRESSVWENPCQSSLYFLRVHRMPRVRRVISFRNMLRAKRRSSRDGDDPGSRWRRITYLGRSKAIRPLRGRERLPCRRENFCMVTG